MNFLTIILCVALFWGPGRLGNPFPSETNFLDHQRIVSCPLVQKGVNIVNIVSTEAYATLKHVLPASLKWGWRKYISHEIETIPIQVTSGKVTKIAYLNIHGNMSRSSRDKAVYPVLFSHGDYAHPYSMLHLIDIAQNESHPTFSLYIPQVQNTEQFDVHNALIKEAIDKIESIVKHKKGNFSGLLGVGHSKGAILLAQRQFVVLDSRIKATCSIAGRLNVPQDNDCADKFLTARIKTIYASILKNSEQPIVQIIPQEDWNASYDSMAVRPDRNCYTVPGMHLSGLYSCETQAYFMDFLKQKSCKSSLGLPTKVFDK